MQGSAKHLRRDKTWLMRPETLFVRAVLVPPARAERQNPGVVRSPSSYRRQAPQNLLQRATSRR
jgi:hypothetical protein